MMNSQQKAAAMYVAVYNRAPDQQGLNFWAGALEAGVPYQEMTTGFLTHPIFDYNYEGLSNLNFVKSIYQNMLGGSGDNEGINFWTNALNSGTSKEEFLTSFIEAVFSYTGNDYSAKNRQKEFVNRVKVALDFTERMGEKSNFAAGTDLSSLDILKNPLAAMSYSAIAGVNSYDNSVLAAINKNKQLAGQMAWVEPTKNYNSNELTHLTDNKWGSANNDYFYARLVGDQVQTLNNKDVLDGGNGRDWLELYLSGRQWNAQTNSVDYINVTKPTLTSIENIEVRAYAPGQTLDLSSSTGITSVTLNANWRESPHSMSFKGVGDAALKINYLEDNIPLSVEGLSGQSVDLTIYGSGQSHQLINVDLNLANNSSTLKPEALVLSALNSYARISGDLSSVKIANVSGGLKVEFNETKFTQLAGFNLSNSNTEFKDISATKWQNINLKNGGSLSLTNVDSNIKSIQVDDGRYYNKNYTIDLTDSTTSSAIRIELGHSHNFTFTADKQKSAETFVLTQKGFNLLQIANFDLNGPVKDKLDVSAFAITNIRDLNIVKYAGNENDVVISAKNGEFDGRILLTGVLAEGADPVSAVANSFIFA